MGCKASKSADVKSMKKAAADAAAAASDAASAAALSLDEIVNGLMEALEVAAEKAVSTVSQAGGFLENEAIKIGIPEPLEDIMNTVKKAPLMDKKVEELIKDMNAAAESAAGEALSIFVDAIKKMDFEDAKAILQGGNGAATKYFKDCTRSALKDVFSPICQSKLDTVDKVFEVLMTAHNAIPFVSNAPEFDMSDYVTDKALDGVFTMLEEQEDAIRGSEESRTSNLLKKVFSDENQGKKAKH